MPIAQQHFASSEPRTTTPASQVDIEEMLRWIESEKLVMASIEVDVKDGKRRVTAAKPKRKAGTSAVNPGNSDGESDAGSTWWYAC